MPISTTPLHTTTVDQVGQDAPLERRPRDAGQAPHFVVGDRRRLRPGERIGDSVTER
jgi:hypothetical protein